MIKVIENFYLALLTGGLVYVVIKNSQGSANIIRESGQGIANLTRVASGGAPGVYGYSIFGGN
jgi:hypothetical protein